MPLYVVKRSGAEVPFDSAKVHGALSRCYAALGREVPAGATTSVVAVLAGKHGESATVEQVQDAVETVLLSLGERDAAKSYMAYRDERRQVREAVAAAPAVHVKSQSAAPLGWGAFAHKVYKDRYSFDGREEWPETAARVAGAVFDAVKDRASVVDLTSEARELIAARKFLPGGRYLASAGREYHQVNNCLMCSVEDTREGWAEHVSNHTMGLGSGAGMGTVYSAVRPHGAPLRRTGGVASGPIPLMLATNEWGRGMRQGGNRRSALWAGLSWKHDDAMDFIHVKNWSPEVRAFKAANWEHPAPMDQTNISVLLDDEFFAAMGDCSHPLYNRAKSVYWATLRNALITGDPGFSVDVGKNAGECLRNACTELTTRDDSDICNIGSLNLARFDTLEEFVAAVEVSIGFLLAGTVYSDVPYQKVANVREKNRRLGLGLMGVHEWLLKRGKAYGPDEDLATWLDAYARSTEIAHRFADRWDISRPVKTRAMAPNGTIGIVAETTTCMEPLLTLAYKRRVKEGDRTWAQYVVDPAGQRLVDAGVSPSSIETAYSLAEMPGGVERRVAFQAWFQRWVDHGIASTINLPHWGSASNNDDTVRQFGEMLLRYLPHLRGITMYPDGARGGQPITSVPYEVAVAQRGQQVYESGDVCDLRGGSCGS